MNRRQELQLQYKETKKEAGVFQFRNTINDKRWVVGTKNLRTMNGKRLELEMGNHRNKPLQKEWNEFGSDAFVLEVLEVLEVKETGYFDENDALKKLEDKWLEELQPFDDRGYNKRKV
ncbi:LuxR family transcriptional regulator [Paenibacillus ferrarius]|uniref:LuxR family transcriptional regulator n=2 Tax=Paenibacillus TaxID=44249 RepID=A0A1V4HK82_9BACL|nr:MULTISPECIES: GIY-YIG nuclease family protein [Paenibacillus]NQX67741.1 GIY-YIG nuclease family protein [Paenibacillus alba]OPH57557.1 LuxR family transcriptional regulator [Paenibacillus ferrarius]